MTAFRPNEDEPTAQEALGGLRPALTPEYVEAIGADALRIVSPRLAARADAGTYYQHEFGLSGVATDMDQETRDAMKRTIQGLRDQTLPGMVNDPNRPAETVTTPEEAGKELLREADESWAALEEAQDEGRLF